MLGVTPSVESCETGTGVEAGWDVSGVIGLSRLGVEHLGRGSLVLSFPEHVAREAVGRILGTEAFPVLDQDVADGIGELVNVIAGRAKQGLDRAGIDGCRTSLPNVILGSQHRVFHMRNARRLAARFSSEIGTFLLQVLLPPVEAGSPVEALVGCE
jgi:chemotaxis protein CheX